MAEKAFAHNYLNNHLLLKELSFVNLQSLVKNTLNKLSISFWLLVFHQGLHTLKRSESKLLYNSVIRL